MRSLSERALIVEPNGTLVRVFALAPESGIPLCAHARRHGSGPERVAADVNALARPTVVMLAGHRRLVRFDRQVITERLPENEIPATPVLATIGATENLHMADGGAVRALAALETALGQGRFTLADNPSRQGDEWRFKVRLQWDSTEDIFVSAEGTLCIHSDHGAVMSGSNIVATTLLHDTTLAWEVPGVGLASIGERIAPRLLIAIAATCASGG